MEGLGTSTCAARAASRRGLAASMASAARSASAAASSGGATHGSGARSGPHASAAAARRSSAAAASVACSADCRPACSPSSTLASALVTLTRKVAGIARRHQVEGSAGSHHGRFTLECLRLQKQNVVAARSAAQNTQKGNLVTCNRLGEHIARQHRAVSGGPSESQSIITTSRAAGYTNGTERFCVTADAPWLFGCQVRWPAPACSAAPRPGGAPARRRRRRRAGVTAHAPAPAAAPAARHPPPPAAVPAAGPRPPCKQFGA